MALPFSEISRAKRRARRKGRLHGRQGMPPLDWNGGPVSYLESLRFSYQNQVNTLELRLRVVEGQSITATEEDLADKESQSYQIAQLEQERSMYETRLSQVLAEKMGDHNENPTGRAARLRHIPVVIYILALIALAVGEYFVTLPATKLILGDVSYIAWLLTGSFAALSIVAAHLIGLTFKIDIDRDKPQPATQRWGAIVIFIFINLVVVLLSAVRSGTVESVPVRFGMSDKVFGTVLFFMIQMSFILCAIALSYYFHSDLESEIRSTKRKIKRLTSRIRNLMKARNTPGGGNLTPEKKLVQIRAITTDMQVLDSEYHELCSIYRGANLLAQKVAFTSPGPGLTELPLELPIDRISKEVSASA